MNTLRIYELKNLNCANCASKIESRIGELPRVRKAKLDFLSKRLVVEGEVSVKEIQRVADAVEEGVVVSEKIRGEKGEADDEERGSLVKEVASIISAVIAGLVVQYVYKRPWQTPLWALLLIAAGFSIFKSALKGIKNGEVFNEKFLMSVASVAAFSIGEHAEALGVLLFYRLGEALQDYALGRATDSVESLLAREETVAHVERDGEVKEIAAEDIAVGDVLVLRAGDHLAADGVIVEGEGHISNQHMTGESVPIFAKAGADMMAGAAALDGAFKVRVTKVVEESAMKKIERLVADARLNKGKTETWIGRFAGIYTPAVVSIAAIVALLPPLVFHEDWNAWIYKACAFLIISCPCALVLSVPLTMFAGVGRASKDGIFIKGSTSLEALAEAEAIAFDKTGTLTDGQFAVAQVDVLKGEREELLTIAATAEQYSNHPIARSILEKAAPKGSPGDYREISGKGITCTVGGKAVAVGNEALLQSLNVGNPLHSIPLTSVYVVEEGELLGRIVCTDSVKPGVKEALKKVKGFLKTYLFSGDKKEWVDAVGRELGIDVCAGGLLPGEKVEALNRILAQDKKVVYVGDGINDAPVLAKSDVGIAMGSGGSDMAIETADVVILGDDIGKIPFLFDLAKQTRKIAFGNIAFALSIKLLVVLLNVANIGNLWLAVFADVGVSLICVFVAMSLLRYKGRK
ncbi:MAG: heavy metal translocating P-type ATPase [Peptoniphilus sp.]|nr:heavy metal translocating P-type ATPase [Peptoniphilus sp.]MDY3118699.1 heavy metal translocating P-type ATPase [Peptoniphilus sp.]